MSTERELLQRLRAVLRDAEVDVEDVVDAAWTSARAEVVEVVRRAMTLELLERVARELEVGAPAGGRVDGGPSGPDPGAGPHERPPHPEGGPVSTAAATAGEPSAPTSPQERADPGDRTPHVRPGADDATRPDAERPDGAHEAEASQAREPVTYVFGITRSGLETRPDQLPRVPSGGSARTLDHAGLRAVVCDVDAMTYRALQEPGPDGLDVLAAAAHAHDEVLARLAAEGPVLPLRLGTMLPDDATVRVLLERHAVAMASELDRVEGHAEWAVIVHLPEEDEREASQRARDEADSGADYLRQRQAALAAKGVRWELRDRLASEIHDRLRVFAVASDTVTRRPLEVEEVGPPALHGVYLLAWEQIAPFEQAVEEARRAYPGTVIEATGPWPPYHFTSVDVSDDAGAT
jgi:hypothetical protein